MDNILMPGETLDDLQNGYYIIQKEKAFRFGVDAVLLSDFAAIKKKDIVIELGTGTGIVPILLYAKKKPLSITAVEILEEMAEMASRSVLYNKLEDHIKVFTMDLNKAPDFFGKGSFNAVVTNPPYLKLGSGIINPEEDQAAARFEVNCTLAEVVASAQKLLMPGGRFYMVHRTDRLADIIYTMREMEVEPKRIRFVHSSYNKKPHLLLIEGIKGGKPELKFMAPLYIYDAEGNYTEEINTIYGRVK